MSMIKSVIISTDLHMQPDSQMGWSCANPVMSTQMKSLAQLGIKSNSIMLR